MRKTRKFLALLLALCLILSLGFTAVADEEAEAGEDLDDLMVTTVAAEDYTGKTVILHSNDVHGAVEGYAYIAALKADFEAKGAEVVLVDAGDFSQGTTYVSVSKGATAVELMNAAGYDFVTLGNHEFDFGSDQLKENMAKGEFKVVCADVYENGELLFDASAVYETKSGVKLGFFGMETPETQTKVNPGLIKTITFATGDDFYKSASDAVEDLKGEGADLVIGIVHLGVDAESLSNGYGSTNLYEKVEGIDVMIDGHSHTVMTEGENGEPIQSTGTKFANIGVIVIDDETKAIESNYLVSTEGLEKDETVDGITQEIITAVDEQYGAVFATTEVRLNGDKAPGNRTEETNLGDLITDSMRWGVLKDLDAETLGVPADNVVAITNGGGIRAWIHVGDVTRNDVNSVLPFGNTVAVVYVKGSELLEALEASTYSTPGAVGGFPQVSGMKYNINT
ncbi:MAG: bifunctional metallophosphatase/5'-nucleotidase, partial [Oscillospiraceae bacterium]|nr:bifunctional metallophosphatase/5'-nucleotidase [Oscillospiraceae bacterium]